MIALTEITLFSRDQPTHELIIRTYTDKITMGRKSFFNSNHFNITELELRENFINDYVKNEIGNQKIVMKMEKNIIDYNVRTLLDILISYQKIIAANNLSNTNENKRMITKKDADKFTLREALDVVAITIILVAFYSWYKSRTS